MSNQVNFFETSNGTFSTEKSNAFINRVFGLMSAALAITGVLAYWFGNDMALMSNLFNLETGKMNMLGWIVMFAPLAFVLVMSFGMNRISYPVLLILFAAYSAVMGVSMSFIFLAYTAASIFKTFVVASVMFAVMAVLGFTTKQDLTKFGSLMMMALIGIIIGSIINFFLKSSMMDYIISIIGVLVFTGLTAYDVQKIKNIGNGVDMGEASTGKLAIMGALNLYLDFVNLFMYLLRLFGDRR